ncbi:unnamed protein product [Prunus armeniaca]
MVVAKKGRESSVGAKGSSDMRTAGPKVDKPSSTEDTCMKASSLRLLIDPDDRVWNQSWATPPKCVKEGIENHFGGAACSISAMNGEEFTWSTSLRITSSKSPPIFKYQSWSFTSFLTSSVHMACGSRQCPPLCRRR